MSEYDEIPNSDFDFPDELDWDDVFDSLYEEWPDIEEDEDWEEE